MVKVNVNKIRELVALGKYDMTFHAMQEMAEDELDIADIQNSIADGVIARIDRGDPRGNKYVIEGHACDGKTPVGSVGRITVTGRYLIITVYEIN